MDGQTIDSKTLRQEVDLKRTAYDKLIAQLNSDTIYQEASIIDGLSLEEDLESFPFYFKSSFYLVSSYSENYDNHKDIKDLDTVLNKADDINIDDKKSNKKLFKKQEKMSKKIEKFEVKKTKEFNKLEKKLSKAEKNKDSLYEKFYKKIDKECQKLEKEIDREYGDRLGENNYSSKSGNSKDHLTKASLNPVSVQNEINDLLEELARISEALAKLEDFNEFIALLDKQTKEIQDEMEKLQELSTIKNLRMKFTHYIGDFESMLKVLDDDSPMKEATQLLLEHYTRVLASL